jgi:aspartate racemase
MTATRLVLIAGLSPGADDFYRDALLEAGCRGQLLTVQANRHVTLRAVSRNEHMRLAVYLAKLINGGAAAGAGVAAIASMTAHICADQLASLIRIPLVGAVDVVAEAVRERGLKRVAVFGGKITMETCLFGGLGDVGVVRPTLSEIQHLRTTYVQLQTGRAAPDDIAGVARIADRLVREEGAEAIILAGAPFSLIAKPLGSLPLLDCARLHINAIVGALTSNETFPRDSRLRIRV